MKNKIVAIDIDELIKLKEAKDELIQQFNIMKAMVYKTNDRALNLAFYNETAKSFIQMVGLWDQWDEYFTRKRDEYNKSRLGMN
jgi:flavoprotein